MFNAAERTHFQWETRNMEENNVAKSEKNNVTFHQRPWVPGCENDLKTHETSF